MRELARWNVIQDELLARRYKNNLYDEKEITRERSITKLLPSGSCWRTRTSAPGNGSRRYGRAETGTRGSTRTS